MENNRINVQKLRVVLMDAYGIHLSNNKAYELVTALEIHHKSELFQQIQVKPL
jgi:hypothetical protein